MLVFVFAAVKIQRLVRGFLIRKHCSLSGLLSHRRQQARLREEAALASKRATSQRQLDKYLRYLDRANRRIREGGGSSHIKNFAKPAWLDGGYSAWCASRIQACWLMVKPRRRFLYKKRFVLHIATLIIQTAHRNRAEMRRQQLRSRDFSHLAAVASPQKREEMRDFCVRRIQLRWRAFCSRRIFRYFCDLVCVKLQGAPADLLKTIIPLETGLFDKAAGVHVRFRLGGAVFPPKIYFKVFTHRPLCDVNAFAPRDYTREEKPEAFHNNNHPKSLPKHGKYQRHPIRVGAKYFDTAIKTFSSDTTTWYHREENNPWRPIASQLFEDVSTPPWQQDRRNGTALGISKKPQPFHFSSHKRREDIIRDKKRRKREWMLKAYMLSSQDAVATEAEEFEKADGVVGGGITGPRGGVGEHKWDGFALAKDGADGDDDDDDNNKEDGDLYWSDRAMLSHGGLGGDREAELADLSVADSKSSGRYWDDRDTRHPIVVARTQSDPRSLQYKQALSLSHKALTEQLRVHRHADEDDEDVDLVDWSAALDFETYYQGWAATGTSKPS